MSRAACEFLPEDEAKAKCREEMETIVKDIKNVKAAEDIIYKFVRGNTEDIAPVEVVRAFTAQVAAAKNYNAANTAALLKVAKEMEAKQIELPKEIKDAISILRLEQGI